MIVFQAAFKLPKFIPPVHFSANTLIETIDVKDYFKKAEVAHWQEWLGTTTWKSISNCDEAIVSWIGTITPEIAADKESQGLESINFDVLRALTTVTSYAFSHTGHYYVLTGDGELVDGKVLIRQIRSYSYVPSYQRSYFEAELKKDDPYFNQRAIIEEWIQNHSAINTVVVGGKLRQLLEALRSLEESYKNNQLEFKIPNLVKSVECLMDCRGAKEFAEMVEWLIGTPPTDDTFQCHVNFNQKLIDLYQLRNDCSHGKQFAWSLQKNYPGILLNKVIGEYEFLAEWVAREVFKVCLNGNFTQIFKDRDTLIAGWRDYKRTIPRRV